MIEYEACKNLEFGLRMFCGLSIFFYHFAQWCAAWICLKLGFALLRSPIQHAYDTIDMIHDFATEHTKLEIAFLVCVILREEYIECKESPTQLQVEVKANFES
ncbi:hypothetical protein IFR05_000404 [Cadophora sp. M221]|nr:hypothetical protein IFR05_000404 [Cadophora sp. M221]